MKNDGSKESTDWSGFFLIISGNSKGLAAVPGREEEFKQCLELSIKYAEAVRCTR